MNRTLPLVLTATAAAVSSLNVGAAHAAASKHTPAKSKKTTHTYKGPVVDMRWGPVQVAIKVKGKKIIDVAANVSPDTARSTFIDQQALPLLKQEVLQVQSADIDTVSGATQTSEAYIESLQAALVKAHLSK